MFRTIPLLRTPLKSQPKTVIPISPSSFFSPQNETLSILINLHPQVPSKLTSPTNPILYSPFSRSSRQKYEQTKEDNERFILNRDPDKPRKLFVVQPRLRPDSLLQVKLSEALNLANSLEAERDDYIRGELGMGKMPTHLVVQNPAARSRKARADTYFGPGTVDTMKCHLNAAEDDLDAVFVNATLSGIQQRNLEQAWGKPVLDRVGLIIEIFNAHAETREAKLQAELAALMYKRTRLVRVRGPGGRSTFGAFGEAEVVSARGRAGGRGGQGFISGAGETELQLQRRRIQERRDRLLSEIAEVRQTRALHRSARRRRGGSQAQGLATVAIVGYTNAGKSTLVSVLSNTYLYSDDRLFATVDPRLRSVVLPSGRKVLLGDTVGFISDLPVQLVEAFHATLEEVVEADLLVHVLDSSASNIDEQRSSVLQVLEQIGVSEDKLHNMIEVWNKVDLLEGESGANESISEDEVDEFDSFPEAEDSGMDSELLSGELVDEEDVESSREEVDEEDVSELSLCRTTDDQRPNFSKDLKMVDDDDAHCQPENVQRVKTSAVMGVGLQELLTLIDEKLTVSKPSAQLENRIYDRKWRPSYTADTGVAVQQ